MMVSISPRLSCVPGLALSLALIIGTGFATVHAQLPEDSLVGTWQGTLAVPGGQLRIVFHIEPAPGGGLTASLDSPDQGAYGIPVDAVDVAGDSLWMEVRAISGVFAGRLSGDGMTLGGEWRQGGLALPLALEHTDGVAAPHRPQEPASPYPYDAEEVAFENEAAGVTLAGTLTRPRGGGPHPAVVLLSGSGPQDRDEAVFGHRPFLVLADYLTRRGLAVLRYDDRGVGRSTGDFSTATTQDFAADAEAAVAFLKGRAGIDASKIGLIGHSEGGLIAPMVANHTDEVAFLVLIAGPGLPGEEILYLQGERINRAGGQTDGQAAQGRAQQERFFAVLKAEPDDSVAAEKLRALAREDFAAMSDEERTAHGFSEDHFGHLVEQQVRALTAPWFRFFLTYDPRPALHKLAVPVLAVIGEKDLQVPPAENLPALEAALKASDSPDVTVERLPGLNHLLQTAGTGAPSEYAQIEETMAPAALERIGDWIASRTKDK